MRRIVVALAAAGSMVLAPAAGAADKDYSDTALNVIPSGQYGSAPAPQGADAQALMYDGLTPLFDNVSNGDLTKYFKSEKYGVSTAGPGLPETVPYPGVTILRDTFNVPHVTATTHEGGVWAAGWIGMEDRGLLLSLARNDAYVAAIDAPGLNAVSLIRGLKQFVPSQATIDETAKQAEVLASDGKEGRAVLADIDTYVQGLNDYIDANSPGTPHFTSTDIFALSALKGQFVGEGGGDEARRSQFLGGLEHDLGVKKGYSVFNDLRQNTNAGSPTTVDGKFNYEHTPTKPGAPGSVVLDPGSFTATPAAKVSGAAAAPTEPPHASNELMINADHSKTGHPLLVGGPQIGFNYPGFTYEIDMHADDLNWRGATSSNLPGYMLIGRGPDFASTLTSAGSDIIDQFAETLCDGSDFKYLYKGTCRDMGTFEAGALDGKPAVFKTTVHGPVIGYATVHGTKVAISRERSSYGKDTLDLLYNRRLSDGQVHSPKSFMKAAALTPQTFNSFYMDSKHTALYTAGLLPKRAKDTDPSLPTVGTGKYDWKGIEPTSTHIQGVDPQNNPVPGTMVNWNNISAHGFGASDNAWGGAGSALRVDMLNKELEQQVNKKGEWSLASVTAAMNAAATQDVRAIDTVPLLGKLLKGSHPPNSQAAQMLSVLKAWNKHGGSRLDKDLDGKIDDPGAAVMDGSWTKLADAIMRPRLGGQARADELATLFSRFAQPPAGQENGWFQYMDRDFKKLLGIKQPQPLTNDYCGGGHLHKCQKLVWGALAAAGTEIQAAQGTPDPTAWRADATKERISFPPGILSTTMRYTNRPTGIQQVIDFKGHR
jgi:acyl-homoserine lactone acylase PvdQ